MLRAGWWRHRRDSSWFVARDDDATVSGDRRGRVRTGGPDRRLGEHRASGGEPPAYTLYRVDRHPRVCAAPRHDARAAAGRDISLTVFSAHPRRWATQHRQKDHRGGNDTPLLAVL